MVVASRTLCLLTACCMVLGLVPGVQAQAAAGETVLYAASMPADGGAVSLSLEAPSGADGTTSCIGTCPSTFTLTGTSDPLPGAIATTATTLEAVAWFKSWNNAPSPATKVDFSVAFDGTEVATGTKTADVMLGAIVEFRVAMDYTGPATIPGGTVVTWVVKASNTACSCYLGSAYPRGVSSDHPWSIALPGPLAAAGGAAPAVANLTGPVAAIAESFTNATTGTYLYHWNGTDQPLALAASANGNGTVRLGIVDAANVTLFDGNLTSNGTAVLVNGTAGNWTLQLDLVDFMGNISVTLGPQMEPPTSSESGSGTANESGSESPSTSTTSTSDEANTPIPFIVPILALLAALAFLRRRT